MEEDILEKKGIWGITKIVIVVIVIGLLALLIAIIFGKDKSEVINNNNSDTVSSNDTIPSIKNLGVNFASFNETTGMAGDFKFSKTGGFNDMILVEFGYHVENEFGSKDQPEITYHLPIGTKVMAIGDGKVTDVTKLYSDDYAILYTANENENWIYTNEHVVNPTVKVGDEIKAGDVVGEVAPYEANGQIQELGFTEIALFTSDSEKITKLCPTMHLDEEVRDKYYSSILKLLSDWEEFKADSSIHDELLYDQFAPGCLKAEVTEIPV